MLTRIKTNVVTIKLAVNCRVYCYGKKKAFLRISAEAFELTRIAVHNKNTRLGSFATLVDIVYSFN